MSEEWAAFDSAWSAAVRLPEGWRLRSLARDGIEVEYLGGSKRYVEWWEATARGPEDQEVIEAGALPTVALFHLVEMLAKRSPVPSSPPDPTVLPRSGRESLGLARRIEGS